MYFNVPSSDFRYQSLRQQGSVFDLKGCYQLFNHSSYPDMASQVLPLGAKYSS